MRPLSPQLGFVAANEEFLKNAENPHERKTTVHRIQRSVVKNDAGGKACETNVASPVTAGK